jgi:cytochrome c-type biogenesis protein CcmH
VKSARLRHVVAVASLFGSGSYLTGMPSWIRWLVLASLLSLASVAGAAEGGRAMDLADQLESPFCPGRTISSCTSPSATKWRIDIQRWVDQGLSSEEIRHRLSARAGRDLRFVPHERSFYGLLALGTVVSLGVVGVITHRVRRYDEATRDEAPATTEDLPFEDDAELDRQLDAELAFED